MIIGTHQIGANNSTCQNLHDRAGLIECSIKGSFVFHKLFFIAKYCMFYPELLNIVKPLSKGHIGDSINSAVVSL